MNQSSWLMSVAMSVVYVPIEMKRCTCADAVISCMMVGLADAS